MADGGFLPDFEPEEDEQELPRPQDKEKPKSYVEKRNFQKYFFCTMLRQQYSGVHISGFRDFLLKPELNRAIQDCGFEHPSEGALLKLELFNFFPLGSATSVHSSSHPWTGPYLSGQIRHGQNRFGFRDGTF